MIQDAINRLFFGFGLVQLFSSRARMKPNGDAAAVRRAVSPAGRGRDEGGWVGGRGANGQ